MSLIVVGMKMPKDCTECRFAYNGMCLANWGRKSKIDITNYCPLVELPPHGDLIDYNFCLKNYELLHDDDGNPVYAVRMRDINAAPVIIEAEEVSG